MQLNVSVSTLRLTGLTQALTAITSDALEPQELMNHDERTGTDMNQILRVLSHDRKRKRPWTVSKTVFSKCMIIIACENIILSFSKNLS